MVADEERLCRLDADDAFFALLAVSVCRAAIRRRECSAAVWRGCTFLALSSSSPASMVMYFSPPILMPLEMTCFGSLASVKEDAMAWRSASVTWEEHQYV